MDRTSAIARNVRAILERADDFEWTLQGFGMLRCYLDERVRLHVWDHRFAFPGASTIHDHPWNFTSTVVSGSIVNRVFEAVRGSARYVRDAPYLAQRIRCGEGGGPVGDPEPVGLRPVHENLHHAGSTYYMEAPWLHETVARRGTVCVVVRDFGGDREHATVVHRANEPWGSAAPRPATRAEVKEFARTALDSGDWPS